MKKTLLLIAVLAAFAACTKTVEVPVEVEVEVEKIVDLLTLNATSIQVPQAGVVQPMSFTTEDSWTISSDASWITFDKASGSAGSSTVNMTVAKNEAFDSRTGRVTLSTTHSGTTKNTVFTVVQSPVEVFNTTVTVGIDYTEQDIEVEFNSNLTPEVAVVDGDWLSITRTKAAPVDGKIVLHAAENADLDTRVGVFTVFAGNSLQTYKVVQASQYAAASSAAALFLGNAQDCYDTGTYSFKQFAQYAIEFSTADGDVTLVLNADPETADKTKVPAGEYTMDDTGAYAANTYSLQCGKGKRVTKVVVGGKEMTIVDGTVTVAETSGSYSIVAQFTDVAGADHLYSYQGELSVEDASKGAYTYSLYYNSCYYTCFATAANEWKVSLYPGSPVQEGLPWITSMDFTVYTASGELTDINLPAGTYTFATPETIESGYPNGNVNAAPGSFDFSAYINETGEYLFGDNNGTLTLVITDLGDGYYSYALKGNVIARLHATDESGGWAMDESGAYIWASETPYTVDFVINDVYSGPATVNMVPSFDGDAEFNTGGFNPTIAGQFYGDVFGNGGNILTGGWQFINGNYEVYIAIDLGPEFEFVPTIRDRYSTQLVPDGVYTYSETAIEGQKTLLPAYYVTASGESSRMHVLNKYTGTYFYITGGSVTFNNGSPTFDLYCTSKKGMNAHFTGTFSSGTNNLDGAYRNYHERFQLRPFTAQ